jgi:UDP-N-acetylmuramoyl-tripeptide--D-alanyl-D-alanine ligase
MKQSYLLEQFLIRRKVTLDSRLVDQETIFFAIKGERHDANDFIDEDLISKAGLVVTERESWARYPNCVIVPDTLLALQNLASDYRKIFKIPVIGITGSNGKTTTKELIHRVLATKYIVHSTTGNFNNHFGVPLTLLQMPRETQIAVIEMGANHQKEIELLSNIAQPDIGLITSIGKAHLEGFGGITGVAKGKSELFEYIKSVDGQIFYHSIDSLLLPYLQNYSSITRIDDSELKIHNTVYHFEILSTEPHIEFRISSNQGDEIVVKSILFGIYNFRNILSAAALGLYFEIQLSQIAAGVASYIPDNNRTQQLKWENHDVILDAYNANPTSMRASIQALEKKDPSKILLILGSMKELGEVSDSEHKDLLQWISKKNWFDVYLFGDEMYVANQNFKFRHFNTLDEIKSKLRAIQVPDLLFFVKGSRSNGLEKLFQ